MQKIRKKILRDRAAKPVSVQIRYTDWLEAERSLNLQSEAPRATDLPGHHGVTDLTEDPLQYQTRIRHEWS